MKVIHCSPRHLTIYNSYGMDVHKVMLYTIFSGLLLTPIHQCWANKVVIDLRYGIVKGYSQYIHFVEKPNSSLNRGRCDAQAVIRVDFSGPYDRVRFKLQYDRPRLWTLDISDSQFGDGYGGDNKSTSNMAETQIYNRQMRIYGNNLPGYLDAAIDGGLLLKVIDNVVAASEKMKIEISDERIEWKTKREKQFIESKFLFKLGGQNATYGEQDNDLYVGFNRVVAGNFRSGSGLCRATISLLQDEVVDRCRSGSSSSCHRDAQCRTTRRAFTCHCKPGFYGNGQICLDDDECEYSNGGCVHSCTNYQGNYTCGCMAGFQLATDGHNCIDVNECFVNRGGCQHQCINTLGTYECKCNTGYSLAPDGKNCIPGMYGCTRQLGCAHSCESSTTGMRCVCRQDYRLQANGRDCLPSCSMGNGGCQHQCRDTPQGPECSCHEKYNLREDGKQCIATCAVNNGGCSKKCVDSPRGPVCSCPDGFLLHQDGKTCLDIDECFSMNGGCSHGCVNAHGSYECICPKGYRVQEDQKTCADVDECAQDDSCDHGCVNHPGMYECRCDVGYERYGIIHCADKNECSEHNGGCDHICENTEGGFQCSCRHGYRLHVNKKDCVAVRSCQDLQVPAKTAMSCTNRGLQRTCRLSCHRDAVFTQSTSHVFEVTCSPDTEFLWSQELNNTVLPSCSNTVVAPGFKRRILLWFTAFHCTKVRKKNLNDWKRQLSPLLVEIRREAGREDLELDFLHVTCNPRKKRRKLREVAQSRGQSLISTELELNVPSPIISERCDVECSKKKGYREMKKNTKTLKNVVKQQGLNIRLAGERFEVVKDVIKARKIEEICSAGNILVNNVCVSCSLGTYHDVGRGVCAPCAPGTYQDTEGGVRCKVCPHGKPHVGSEGAQDSAGCGTQCEPGTYSPTGFKPCRLCPYGTYQPVDGRTKCLSCGTGVTTRTQGANSFQQCQVRVRCSAGEYYDSSTGACAVCPIDTYQPGAGQNYCIDCPGQTHTDDTGSTNSSQCKNTSCGGIQGEHQGFIQSPNWPGPYPNNIECVWHIRPAKRRRVLLIIPEIFLASQDKCGDVISMRKSQSPYSLLTYETCESTETPIAFTARSKKLWIQFKSDGQNSNKGFSIPYVTYEEEYQNLIEDIVRDGRLYSSYQHQEVLKDKRLLSALMEVIAQPYHYFKYAQESHNMFPATFIKLIRNKVMRFFDISYE